MKTIKSLFFSLILAVPSIAQAVPFFQAETGMIASPGSQAPIYGFRCGADLPSREYSLGYWTGRGMSSGQLVSGGLNLHVLSAEAYHVFPIGDKLRGKLGGGIGYAIPNLDGGASEIADNGHSWVFGGGVNYEISKKMTLAGTVKGFFFTTNTHVTTYTSHSERLLVNGTPAQMVEVVDVGHYDDVVDFNSVLLTISLRW